MESKLLDYLDLFMTFLIVIIVFSVVLYLIMAWIFGFDWILTRPDLRLVAGAVIILLIGYVIWMEHERKNGYRTIG